MGYNNNQVNDMLFSFVRKQYLSEDAYQKFCRNNKNLRKCIESMYNFNWETKYKLCYGIMDSWNKSNTSEIWNKKELLVFKYLLRNKGVSTISELSNNTGLDDNNVRDAVTGLEEVETNPVPILTSVKYGGNTKIVFLSPYYVFSILDKVNNQNNNQEK